MKEISIIIPCLNEERQINKCLNSLSSQAPYQIFNVGNSQPINLINFINVLEEKIGKKAKKNFKSH